ncbi:MAG: prepilin-type N-terminal cleavage/methylation domain-containing protein [Myxococcales bacterium]|nr:prepilin-type N-terminal cleavage/methylation domain-containing protein [Myxococcales bacterium]
MGRARPFVLLVLGGAALAALWSRERYKAQVRSTRATLLATRRAVDAYRAEHPGECPRGGLDGLVVAGYLPRVPLDAWNQRLRLVCPSRRPSRPYDLSSDGPDGEPGGLDRVELGMPPHACRLAMNMTPSPAISLRRIRRVLTRGVTLIEVLIVVAILSMIAAGVTVAVLPKFKEAAVKNTETNAREIRNAVQRWRGLRGGSDCPSISQLVQDKEIDSASKTDDAWGSPYKITCTEDDVIVSSSGPDKKEGSSDDIVVPKGAQRLAMARHPEPRLRRRVAARRARAFTLIELIVVVTLAAMLMGGVILGMGSVTNARLKGAVTLVSSAIRSAYTRASAVSRPMRVVFDIDGSRVWLEEGSTRMLVNDLDPTQTGGADPATEAERLAAEQASKILKGPTIPKPRFQAIKQPGFEEDEPGKPGRALGGKLHFREIHVFHQPEPLHEGRAYLYLWPGGQTEQAYIQIAKSPDADHSGVMTLTVHPLTGKVRVLQGPQTLPMSGVGQETFEREDRGGL